MAISSKKFGVPEESTKGLKHSDPVRHQIEISDTTLQAGNITHQFQQCLAIQLGLSFSLIITKYHEFYKRMAS